MNAFLYESLLLSQEIREMTIRIYMILDDMDLTPNVSWVWADCAIPSGRVVKIDPNHNELGRRRAGYVYLHPPEGGC